MEHSPDPDETRPAGEPPRSERPAYWLLFYPVSFLVCLQPIFSVLTPFGVIPRGSDAYYHMRRIVETIATYPRLPNLDHYVNFPDGVVVYWPFGFDFLYATFVLICTRGHADLWWALALSSLMTPLVGAAIPCLVYLIGERVGGPRAGIWAGLVWTILPFPYIWFGYIDHHVFEPFWLAVYLLAYLHALERSDEGGWRPLRAAFVAGCAITAGLLCTTILPLLVPLHVGISSTQIMREWKDRGRRFRLATLSLCLWGGLLVTLAPFVLTTVAEPAGINPSLLTAWHGALAAGLATLGVAWRARDADAGLPASARVAAIVLALLVVAVAVRTDLLGSAAFALQGIGLVLVRDPLWADLVESQRLLEKGFWFVIGTYTGLVLVWPFLLAYMLRSGWRRSGVVWVVALTGLAGSIIALLQTRFGLFLGVPYSVLLGYAFDRILVRSSRGERGPILQNVGVAAAVAGFVLALAASLTTITFGTAEAASVPPEWREALAWIRRRTPPTSASGTEPSDYSIVADWNYGHWLVFMAGRPVVGSPLGYPESAREGVRDGAAALVFPPRDALEILGRRRARYVIVPLFAAAHNARLAYWDTRTRSYPPGFEELPALRESLMDALLRGISPAGRFADDALSHFRLVYELWSDGQDGTGTPAIALFERVRGAAVVGRALPGAVVRVSAPLRTGLGRRFEYRAETRADVGGVFRLVLPYAYGAQPLSDVGLVAPYQIESGGVSVAAEPSEDDVLSGAAASVDLTAQGSAGARVVFVGRLP